MPEIIEYPSVSVIESIGGGNRRVMVAVDERESSHVAFQYLLQRLLRPESDLLVIVHIVNRGKDEFLNSMEGLRRDPPGNDGGVSGSAQASWERPSPRFARRESSKDSQWEDYSCEGRQSSSGWSPKAGLEGKARSGFGDSFSPDNRRPDQGRSAEQLMERYCRDAEQQGVEYQSHIVEAADAGPAIVKKVDQVGAELLVIGQRALSKRKRGKKAGGAAPTLSISDYCGTYSSCPVLIVRPSMPSRGKDARTGKDMRKLLAGMALE
eukprot:TRINITY_DN394_c0_g2_i3.p1 TRINITY_DN394_c0_g2~~TRINITY_DN394_c0_g2_i3.p1  ORF type:complete len:266 (+),score=50.99 TRINITY_DN394_c0_g2_i3:335-1132(+)